MSRETLPVDRDLSVSLQSVPSVAVRSPAAFDALPFPFSFVPSQGDVPLL